MTSWLIPLVAVISTTLCLFLWFREVRRIMRERKSTVDSAGRQLAVCRERAQKARGDPAAEAVLERSEKIYRQSVYLYNQTLRKPLIYGPAILMRYRPILPKGTAKQHRKEG